MRILITLAVLAGLCACGDPEQPKSVDASKELRPHIEKLYAAWGTLDLTKIAPFYAKETGTAFFDIAPLKYASWADYAAGFKKGSADWASVTVDISPDFQAHSNGPIAWATFTGDFKIVKKDGKVDSGKARVTEILQRDGKSWLIIHEHVSVPMMEPAPAPVAKKAVARKAGARKKGARRR